MNNEYIENLNRFDMSELDGKEHIRSIVPPEDRPRNIVVSDRGWLIAVIAMGIFLGMVATGIYALIRMI